MEEAMTKLADLKKAIDIGEEGRVIIFPLNEAALAFRISEKTLRQLEYSGREVVISTVDGDVVTELRTGEVGRRAAYCLLHHLILEARDGTADKRLEEIEKTPPLVKEILGSNLSVLREHGKLDEQDLTTLHFKLFVLRESLRDKVDLPRIENLFPTQFL